MEAFVVYSTSPRIEDHREILHLNVNSIVTGLQDITDALLKPGGVEKVSDDWIQLTVTIIR